MATIKGGDKLRQVLAQLGEVGRDKPLVRVGFLENATYPDGTPVAMIAAIQDFGAPRAGIPPRPFFRNMVADKQAEWGPALGKQLKANGYDARKALETVGDGIVGQLKQSIIDTNEPPLAPSTIRAKGFDKPLIDQGIMINSVDREVVAK